MVTVTTHVSARVDTTFTTKTVTHEGIVLSPHNHGLEREQLEGWTFERLKNRLGILPCFTARCREQVTCSHASDAGRGPFQDNRAFSR